MCLLCACVALTTVYVTNKAFNLHEDAKGDFPQCHLTSSWNEVLQ